MHDFSLSFTEVGALMCFLHRPGIGKAAAGFAVDRFGPTRVLMFGVSCLAAAGLFWRFRPTMRCSASALRWPASATRFHPADFTILNGAFPPSGWVTPFQSMG